MCFIVHSCVLVLNSSQRWISVTWLALLNHCWKRELYLLISIIFFSAWHQWTGWEGRDSPSGSQCPETSLIIFRPGCRTETRKALSQRAVVRGNEWVSAVVAGQGWRGDGKKRMYCRGYSAFFSSPLLSFVFFLCDGDIWDNLTPQNIMEIKSQNVLESNFLTLSR